MQDCGHVTPVDEYCIRLLDCPACEPSACVTVVAVWRLCAEPPRTRTDTVSLRATSVRRTPDRPVAVRRPSEFTLAFALRICAVPADLVRVRADLIRRTSRRPSAVGPQIRATANHLAVSDHAHPEAANHDDQTLDYAAGQH